MSVNTMNGVASVESYASYNPSKVDSSAKQPEAESVNAEASTTVTDKTATEGVVYEKSENAENSTTKTPYSVNKMSKEDRAALIQQLKADEASRQAQLTDIVKKMMTEQATSYANANDMWKFLAKGDFTVDAQTKLQAQKDISEDGYYGVKQTSERLFDFASALAGDDVDKMKEMQAAMEKGFKQATKAWGQDLPDISQKTLEAANKKFEEYYASKEQSDTTVQ
ncbi:MAG: hypothetical protein SPE81_05020 [Agathobacter sp.]|nr:hypothetical protein [Agathobacter sp.]